MTQAGLDDPDEILGLTLPEALRTAIAQQRWIAPTDRELVEAVFSDEAPHPYFYDLRYIEKETRNFGNFRNDPRGTLRLIFIGTPPHDIDPDQCLIIGDLGPDQPFALDYRSNAASPPVRYLHSTMDWIEVAADINTLLRRLNIEPIDPQPAPHINGQ